MNIFVFDVASKMLTVENNKIVSLVNTVDDQIIIYLIF